MSPACTSRVVRMLVVFGALGSLATAGCPWSSGRRLPADPFGVESSTSDNSTSDNSTPDAPSTVEEVRAVARRLLETEAWARTIESLDASNDSADGYRWRHPGVEELLARPKHRRPDLHAVLMDDEPVVAANAAISLARLHDSMAIEPLGAAVRDPRHKISLRLAAAEALGCLADPAAVALLGELLDQYDCPSPDEGAAYLPAIHAELLLGLAQHGEPDADRRFVEAFRAETAEVRLAAVRPWQTGRQKHFPIELADLHADPDPRVRVAVLGAVARQRPSEAHAILVEALSDYEFQVRIAAIDALGCFGGSEAQAVLVEQLDGKADLIRAAAVTALVKLDAWEPVLEAASDQSWRVRAAVAHGLARYYDPRDSNPRDSDQRGVDIADQLANDPSTAVRREMLEAIGTWPPARSGSILLDAMAGAGYETRRTAARQLTRLWSPAAEFPVSGPIERRRQVLAELERRFQSRFKQQSEPAEKNEAPIAAEHATSSGIDVALERLFGRLASEDVSTRREAAIALAERAGTQPLGPSTCSRLASIVRGEPDPLVWQSVLAAVRTNDDEPAAQMAYIAIGHESADVRRRACAHLTIHPDPRHVAVLLPALEDPTDSVRLAAVRALAAAGRLETAEPLKQLLTSSNGLLRVEAAVALCRVSDPSGPAALERLAYDDDPALRRQAALAMGQIAEPSFAGALTRLLDDRRSVSDAALKSLPQVAGRDVTRQSNGSPNDGPPPDRAQQIQLWKTWQSDLDRT